MSTNSSESFTGEKKEAENLWIRLKRLSVSHFIVHSWTWFGAPKGHRMPSSVWHNVRPQCRCGVRYSFIYSSPLSFSFFVPIVTFHLFAFQPKNVNRLQRSSTFLVPWMFEQQPNTPARLCILDSLLRLLLLRLHRFFRTIKGNEKPFERAIEQMMITTTTHDDCPKYFDFFWCSVLRPFYSSNVLLLDVLFISGSLKKFIGSLSFLLTLFETKWWTNNATLSLKCLLRREDE